MEHLLGGFQLPFQRRLTKMYTDTKSSYDFVKEPVQVAEDPELSSLYRKLRIQKDRLVSWGLGWSDPSQSPDIDESISKAGLSDVVGNVMSTIKDILAEAEPLWQSSQRTVERRGSEKPTDSKTSLVSWDRARFEDLIKDLTSSIDILCDLSMARQSSRLAHSAKQLDSSTSFSAKVAKAEQARQFESTRMKAPQQIDPSTIISYSEFSSGTFFPLSSITFPVGDDETRQIVFMRRQSSSTNPWKLDGPPPIVPMILEFAGYDSIYANTGITPSMDRFEKLFSGLQLGQDAATRPEYGTLNLVGYYEDATKAHFGLLYEMPNRFDLLSPNEYAPYASPYISTLSSALSSAALEPALEVRYRLAFNVATTVSDLHAKGIIHGNLSANTVTFFDKLPHPSQKKDGISLGSLRLPFLTSFDLFPDNHGDDLNESSGVYKHPLDPKRTPYTKITNDSRSLDLYSLGLILLEIGLWRKVSDSFPPRLPNGQFDFPPVYRHLASRCGSAYMKAVRACICAVDTELENIGTADAILRIIYDGVTSALERCCAIDDGIEDERYGVTSSVQRRRDSDDGNYQEATLQATTITKPVIRSTSSQPPFLLQNDQKPLPSYEESGALEYYDDKKQQTALSKSPLGNSYEQSNINEKPQASAPRQRLRLFVSVGLEQRHLDYWHTVLMPNINHTLRSFYRKYPESVEISLESIGETANTTRPTMLVVCTSVGKVRSILRKSFVYDSSTYGLMVCKGKVFRSRKHNTKRSMLDESDPSMPKPKNPDYQERPFNGASIGAYAEGQHLPPVSFGGLIMVDDKPYGMTVHHMLDDPADQEEDDESQVPDLEYDGHMPEQLDPARSNSVEQYQEPDSEENGYEISDYGSDTYSEISSEADSEYSENGEFQACEPGDIEGIPEGCGQGYAVTQPALDDVEEGFFPSQEAAEEDHLDTFRLGEIYASSGIRRKHQDGMAHEIDWALFEFSEERQPPRNFIQGGENHCSAVLRYPVEIAPWTALHGLEVHCNARTTGLQNGRIMPGMTVVKIFGRQTPSQSYQVAGKLGIPGDSGAWVIDNNEGRACGHVLAWSSRKQVAYICPMEILFSDIAETLDAKVCLPDPKINFSTINEGEEVVGELASMSQLSISERNLPTPVLDHSAQMETLKNLKHIANARYTIPSDENLVSALDSMHVSHGVVSS